MSYQIEEVWGEFANVPPFRAGEFQDDGDQELNVQETVWKFGNVILSERGERRISEIPRVSRGALRASE